MLAQSKTAFDLLFRKCKIQVTACNSWLYMMIYILLSIHQHYLGCRVFDLFYFTYKHYISLLDLITFFFCCLFNLNHCFMLQLHSKQRQYYWWLHYTHLYPIILKLVFKKWLYCRVLCCWELLRSEENRKWSAPDNNSRNSNKTCQGTYP